MAMMANGFHLPIFFPSSLKGINLSKHVKNNNNLTYGPQPEDSPVSFEQKQAAKKDNQTNIQTGSMQAGLSPVADTPGNSIHNRIHVMRQQDYKRTMSCTEGGLGISNLISSRQWGSSKQ